MNRQERMEKIAKDLYCNVFPTERATGVVAVKAAEQIVDLEIERDDLLAKIAELEKVK